MLLAGIERRSSICCAATSCDPGFEFANVNHFESLRARLSNEFSARAYNARL